MSRTSTSSTRTRALTWAAVATACAVGVVGGYVLVWQPDRVPSQRPVAASAGVDTRTVVAASADELLPGATETDVRTFADHLVVVHVLSEREVAPGPDEVAASEGLIGREVTFAVDATLWSRPGAPKLPAQLQWQVPGWSFKGDQRTPVTVAGATPVQAGQQYLVPAVFVAGSDLTGPGGWAPLTSDSVVPYDEGVVGEGVDGLNEKSHSWISGYGGRPATEASAALRAARPMAGVDMSQDVLERVAESH